MNGKGLTFLLLGLLLVAMPDSVAVPANADPALTNKVRELDTQLFGTFNRCEMDAHRQFFAPNVEFYHDDGGATFDREQIITDTRNNICGKVQRHLLPETFKVYPVAKYGAIAEGEHIFCELASGQCQGAAKFMVIWSQKGGEWQLTRIASYGHRQLSAAEKAQYAPPAKSR
jgi:hypothetical protein